MAISLWPKCTFAVFPLPLRSGADARHVQHRTGQACGGWSARFASRPQEEWHATTACGARTRACNSYCSAHSIVTGAGGHGLLTSALLTRIADCKVGGQSLQQVAKAIKEAVIEMSRGAQHPNVEMNGVVTLTPSLHLNVKLCLVLCEV